MTSVVPIASYDVTSVRTHNIGSMQFKSDDDDDENLYSRALIIFIHNLFR